MSSSPSDGYLSVTSSSLSEGYFSVAPACTPVRTRGAASSASWRSRNRAKNGFFMVESAGSTIQGAVASVQQLVVTMGEITAANREQSAGLEQINQAVTHMDNITQQNAALVEQVAATAVTLDQMAARAAQAVSAFRLGGGGGGAPRIAAAPRTATPPAARAPAPSSRAPARARDRAA